MSPPVRRPGPALVALAVAAVAVTVGLPAFGLGYALWVEPAGLSRAEMLGALPLLRDSVVLSVAVAAAATAVGGTLAWATSRLHLPFAPVVALFALLPLGMPSYLLAATAQRALFGPVAPLGALGGLPAAFLVLTVVTAPVVQLVVAAALARCSASEEESARTLGAGALRVAQVAIVPRVRAALALGFVLAFVYALSDFGAVAVLDAPVLTFRLYLAVAAHDLPRASLYGGLLLAAAVPTLLLAGAMRGRGHRAMGVHRAPAPMRAGPLITGAAVTLALLLGVVGVVLPAIELGRWAVLGLIDGRVAVAALLDPLAQSVALSAAGALVTLVLAGPVAWVAARGNGGWLRQAAWLASALPGPLLAFGWLLAAIAGARFGLLPYSALLGSGLLLLLGYATRFLAEAAAPLEDGILNLDPRMEAAARSLGASRARWGLRVAAPALVPSTLAAAVLAFVAILKELPVTLLLGAPAGATTLAFRVFDRYNEALYGDAGLAGLALLGVTLAALLFTLRRR